MDRQPAHSFHIPVMGTAFTVDSPLRVGRYGIGSTVSIVDDHLCESVRRWYLRRAGQDEAPIPAKTPRSRERRITAWLDHVWAELNRQTEALRAAPAEPGSELWRYVSLLPAGPRRAAFEAALALGDPDAREAALAPLRAGIRPGTVEVNIMAKVDRARDGEDSDAVAALKGVAASDMQGAVVLSAGMNPRLYGALGDLDAFRRPTAAGFEKEVVLKVSDFRSATIQGRYLAKKGIWISEYRIESGINCGGHAFVTEGRGLGLVLDDFREGREALSEGLLPTYNKALAGLDLPVRAAPPPVRVTVQGGVGTAEEHALFLDRFGVDRVGWGSPFLLVPEAVMVDQDTLARLCASDQDSLRLGEGSPFGVPFWSLATSPGEAARQARMDAGKPGTACPKGFLAANTEFTERPLCTAARAYHKKAWPALDEAPAPGRSTLQASLAAKLCLCQDLAGTADRLTGDDPEATPVVCPGPNLAWFNREASLEEMVGHIYGRTDLVVGDRPHVLVRELELYADFLEQETGRLAEGVGRRDAAGLQRLRENLVDGVAWCRDLTHEASPVLGDADLARLDGLERRLGENSVRLAQAS